MTDRVLRTVAGGLMVSCAAAGAQEVRLRPTDAVYADARGGAMSAPEAVDFDGGSRLVVADTGNRRLLLFDVEDGRASASGEIRLDQLPYPTRVRFDSGGRILALDGRSHRIVRVGGGGEFLGRVDLAVAGTEEPLVKDFELDDEDRLYVLDVAGARVLVVDRDGALERRIAFPPDVGFLSALAVDGSGVVFAVDSVRRRVLAARRTDDELAPLAGGLAADSAFPTAVVADRTGRLFVADQSAGGIVILERDGSFLGRQSAMGWKEGFLRHPSGLAAGGGLLFVADRGNNRVQVFSILD